MGNQLSHERVHVLPIGNVKFHGTGLVFAMSVDEVIEPVLSAADRDDFRAFLDKTVGHCGTDARCSTDHEDVFVLERHFLDRFPCV